MTADGPSEAEAANELMRLARAIARHNRLYHAEDAPEISDAEYDALVRRNAELEAAFPHLVRADSPSQAVGHEVSASPLSKVAHEVRMMSLDNAFTDEDIAMYKEAWSQPGAMTAMLNWYRAAARHQPEISNDMHVHIRTLILWGVQDFALSRRMARPSLDYCDDGNLVFYPDATHWVQREEADEVNRQLLSFILT